MEHGYDSLLQNILNDEKSSTLKVTVTSFTGFLNVKGANVPVQTAVSAIQGEQDRKFFTSFFTLFKKTFSDLPLTAPKDRKATQELYMHVQTLHGTDDFIPTVRAIHMYERYTIQSGPFFASLLLLAAYPAELFSIMTASIFWYSALKVESNLTSNYPLSRSYVDELASIAKIDMNLSYLKKISLLYAHAAIKISISDRSLVLHPSMIKPSDLEEFKIPPPGIYVSQKYNRYVFDCLRGDSAVAYLNECSGGAKFIIRRAPFGKLDIDLIDFLLIRRNCGDLAGTFIDVSIDPLTVDLTPTAISYQEDFSLLLEAGFSLDKIEAANANSDRFVNIRVAKNIRALKTMKA